MLYLYVSLSKSRLCYALCPSWACAYQSPGPLALCGCIHPSSGLFGCNHLWDTPLWCWCAWFTPFSTLCDVDILALLALCHPFGFLCIFASLHACLHVHAWVCVSSILQSNGTWTLDPNLHLSSYDTPFCLITCLFPSSCASHVCLPPFGIFG